MRSAMHAGIVLAAVATGAAAQGQMTVVETIDFDGYDREATHIVKAMYGDKFELLEAAAFWLIEPSETTPRQIAMRIGRDDCEGGCQVAVLYHTGEAWAEIWRGEGDVLRLGPVDPATGLRSIIGPEREWVWSDTDRQYFPFPRGKLPPHRDATDQEGRTASRFIREVSSLPPDADLSVGGAADFPLTEDGAGAAVYIMGQACAGNGACPVVFLDADGTPVGWVMSLGPDVRDAEGLDDNGFTRVETSIATGVAIVGASTRDKLYGVVGPQPVTRAGDPRPSENADQTTPSGVLPGPNQ